MKSESPLRSPLCFLSLNHGVYIRSKFWKVAAVTRSNQKIFSLCSLITSCHFTLQLHCCCTRYSATTLIITMMSSSRLLVSTASRRLLTRSFATTKTADSSPFKHNLRNVVVVAGVRIPFAQTSSIYADEMAVDLQRLAIQGLLTETALPKDEIDCEYHCFFTSASRRHRLANRT